MKARLMLGTLAVAVLLMFSSAVPAVVVSAASAPATLPGYLPRSNPPGPLYLVKLGGNLQLNYPVAALEGLVARNQPQLYLSKTANDQFWLTYSAQKYGFKYQTITETSALQMFKNYVTDSQNGKIKIILYSSNDPINPAQINMARTLAGVYSALPVSTSELSAVQSVFGSANLETLYSLSGMFSDKVSAYNWLWNQVGSQVTRSLVTTSPDGDLGMTDYIVQHKSFVFEFTNSQTLTKSQSAAATSILRNYPQGTPVMGFFGFGPEAQTITFLSQLGLFMTPADTVSNLSFFSGLPMEMNLHQSSPSNAVSYSPTKTYIAITYSQGNSLGYMFNGNRQEWEKTDSQGVPIRSLVPEAWQINPVLAQIAPPVISYWYSTMYPADSFITAASGGAGYVHPDELPNLPSYLNLADQFSSNADLNEFFIVPGVHQIQPSLYQSYIQGTSAKAIYAKQPHGAQPQMVAGAPIFSMTYGVVSQTSYTSRDVTAAVNDLTSLSSEYKFIWIFMNAKNPGQSFLLSLLDQLPSNFVALRADQFADVYQQSLSGGVTKALEGYWPLNEGAGTQAADLSTNTNGGTLHGGTTWRQALGCQFVACVEFDGSTGYISATSSGLPTGTSSRTTTAWIYPIAFTQGGSALVSYGNLAGGGQAFTLAVSSGGKLEFESGSYSCVASATIPLKQWTFVAVTYSSGAKTVTLYIGSTPYSCTIADALNTGGGNLFLGQLGGSSQYFSGRVDDARVYSIALSLSQIKTLLNTIP